MPVTYGDPVDFDYSVSNTGDADGSTDYTVGLETSDDRTATETYNTGTVSAGNSISGSESVPTDVFDNTVVGLDVRPFVSINGTVQDTGRWVTVEEQTASWSASITNQSP